MENRPKNGYGYIYKYTSPSGKSYIGQTCRSLKERAGHNGKNYHESKLFYSAIQKYGFNNFEVVILAEVPQAQLDEAEKKNIVLFNTLAPNGYNLTSGGQHSFDRSTKKVYQYAANDGHFIKEWENANEAMKPYGVTGNVLESCLLGFTYTQYGSCWSYIKLKKFPIHERVLSPEEKKVCQYSLDGMFIAEYKSIAAAARATHSERSAIKRCCRHELLTHNNYKWECKEILLEKRYNNTAKKIQQINPDTHENIHVFPSISAAAHSLGKSTSLIRRVLDTGRCAYGYIWKTA